MNKNPEHKLCVSLVPIFNHLEQPQMQEIAKLANTVKHGRGETVYHQGDRSKGLYILHKGVPSEKCGFTVYNLKRVF